MSVQKYKTKTEFIPRNNGRLPGIWESGIDIGYSAVKLYAPNKVAGFPSYARRVDSSFQFAGTPPKDAILYKDLDTNENWLVGGVAQEIMASGDTTDSESSLYGRERYNSAMFRVICRAGLGLSMMANHIMQGPAKTDRLVVQTGLPEMYMNDETDLRDALSGEHHFSLKIGSDPWYDFSFELKNSNIFLMPQPKGTLFSVCIGRDGNFVPDAEKYLSSSVIVFDPGFGTLDLFPINSGVVGHGETYSDLGMKRVLQETSKGIKEKYNVDIPVPFMQKYLETGMVRYLDKKSLVSKEYPFEDILYEASEKVCEEAIGRMMGTLQLIDYNYLIVTGGTGSAWYPYIENKFKELSTLKLIKGNQNDNLPFIYSNVRGYYLYCYKKLLKS